jgi:hypothetical protein
MLLMEGRVVLLTSVLPIPLTLQLHNHPEILSDRISLAVFEDHGVIVDKLSRKVPLDIARLHANDADHLHSH